MPFDPPPPWPAFGPLPPPTDVQYGNNPNPSGGVTLMSPGGGSVPNFPWDAVLPTLSGTPAPSQVAGNNYGPPGAKLECASVGARQALAYGTVRLIGRRLYQQDNDTSSANFATGFTVGPIQGFTKYFANGIDVTSATGFTFSSYNGTTPQSSDSWLTSIFPGATLAGTSWFRAFVQITGIIPPGGWRILVPGDSSQVEWGADLQGLLLYDPRSATTYWSNNPALVIWDLLVRVGGFSSSDLDPVTFGAAADICDTLVGSPSAKRFMFDGAFTEEDSLQQMLNSVRMTCNGEIYMEDGLIKLWVDVENAGSPVLALNELTNIEHLGYSWVPAEEQPTRVVIEFPNKDLGYKLDYKTVDSPLLAGGSVDQKVVTMRAEGCVDEVHAGRIGTYIVNQSSTPLRISGDASFAAAILSRGSKVSLTTGTGLTSSSHFLVLETNRKEGGLRALTLRQYNAAVYADAAVSGTLPPYTGPPTPGAILDNPPPVVAIATVTGGAELDARIWWTQPMRYKAPVTYGAAYWSDLTANLVSFDASKVNDGNTSVNAFEFYNGATSKLRFDSEGGGVAGATKRFGKVRIWVDTIEQTCPVVQTSGGTSLAPLPLGAGGWMWDYSNCDYLVSSGTWIELEWGDIGAQRYWDIGQLFITASTFHVKEVQFYEIEDEYPQSWIEGYEIHAGPLATSPLVAFVPGGLAPSLTEPFDASAFITQTPGTDLTALEFDLTVVVRSIFGRKSTGREIKRATDPPWSGVTITTASDVAPYVMQRPSAGGVAQPGNANLGGIFQSKQLVADPQAAGTIPLEVDNVATPTVALATFRLNNVEQSRIDKKGSLATLRSARVAPWLEAMVFSTATTINSTTAADITGLVFPTFTPPSDVLLNVYVCLDGKYATTGSGFLGELVVNGTPNSVQIVWNPQAVNDRIPLWGHWQLTLSGGTSYAIKMQGKLSGGAGSFTIAANSRMSALGIAGF